MMGEMNNTSVSDEKKSASSNTRMTGATHTQAMSASVMRSSAGRFHFLNSAWSTTTHANMLPV